MEYIIETENISKYYGNLKAVDNVSLGVKKGEIYGFLGLNGAGKTTTIRMLLGMISPSTGIVCINGRKVSPAEKRLWEKVGYLVEIPYAYPELTVRENLWLFCKLRMIHNSLADKIIDKLKLTQYRNVKAGHLSQGNLQRLGIARALMHNPDILILDEPANGLDPAGIVEMRELLKELASNEGKTIFISSHILAEISKMADRIGIIHQGRLVKEMDDTQLEKEREKKLVVSTRRNEVAFSILTEAGYKVKSTKRGWLEVNDEMAIEFPEKVATLLVQNKTPPFMLNVEVEDLESYFLRIIGGKK
ncbi:MAG: ABC transporter ATP-binding protein [Brevinematia bacterium]